MTKFPNVCACRPGSWRLCPTCLRAHQPGPLNTHADLAVDPDDLRAELALLGMTEEEIKEMTR
jgi:hypothetical protein